MVASGDALPSAIGERRTGTHLAPPDEGVDPGLVDKLVDNLTWTGDYSAVDRFVEEMLAFKAAGVTEMAVRLYGEPEAAIRLLAERVMPAVQGS